MLRTLTAEVCEEPILDARQQEAVEAVLGLVGTSGEVSDLVKGWMRDGGAFPQERIADSLSRLHEHLFALAAIAEIDVSKVVEIDVSKVALLKAVTRSRTDSDASL